MFLKNVVMERSVQSTRQKMDISWKRKLKILGQRRRHEQCAKIHNPKQAANATNFFTENKIEQYINLTVIDSGNRGGKQTDHKKPKEHQNVSCKYGGAY